MSGETRLRPLRVRHNAKTLAWVDEPGRGKEASKRRDAKLYYSWIVGHMLRPNWGHLDGNLTFSQAADLLKRHRDFPAHKSAACQRQWLSRTLKLICTMPNVVKMPRYLMLVTMLEDHGGWQAIEEHHQELRKARRRTFAKASQKFRDNAKFWASKAHSQIVNNQPSCALTSKSEVLYNASTPPANRVPTRPQQAARFVASPPRRANAVSANRVVAPKPTPTLASIRSRSDKTLAQPSIPLPPRYIERHDFDPRAHAKAKRIYAHGPLDAAYVAMMVDVHAGLKGLSFDALRANGATNDSVYKACHLYANSAHKVTHPVGWVLSTDRRLREGKLRYA